MNSYRVGKHGSGRRRKKSEGYQKAQAKLDGGAKQAIMYLNAN